MDIVSIGGVNWTTKLGGIVNIVWIRYNAYLISTNILECDMNVDVGARINQFCIIYSLFKREIAYMHTNLMSKLVARVLLTP